MKFKSTGITSNSAGIKFLLVVIIGIILGCVYQSRQVLKTGKRITKSQDILLLSKKVLTHTLDNESSFRGYILTGQNTYLQPLAKYRKEIYDEIGLLKVLTTDNNAQQKLLDSLILYINKRIIFSNSNIARYDRNEANAVMKAVETGEGKSYTDRIRLLVDKVQEIENGFLAQHKKIYESAIGSFQKVLWWLIAGIFLVLVLFIQKGRLDNIEKGKAAANLMKMNDELEQRVTERTKELNKKEKLFRALVENNEGIISLIDEKLNVLFSSSSASLITGGLFEENKVVGVGENLPVEGFANVKELIARAIANPGKMIPVSIKIKQGNGYYTWLEGVFKNMIHDPAIGGIIINLRDISKRKKAEEEIEKLATLVKNSPEFIGIANLDARTIYLNDGGKKMVELTGEVVDTPIFDMFTPEDLSVFKKRVLPAIKNAGRWIGEIHLRNFRTGQRIPVLMDIFYILNPTTQEPVAYGTVTVNITERKNAEIKIKAAIERYEILAKATSDTIWDWDIVNNTMLYNEGITNVFGYPTSEVKNIVNWWNEKIYPEDYKNVARILEDVFEMGLQRCQLSYRFRCADGSYKHVFDRAFVIFDEHGKPCRMIGAMQDITYRVEEEMRTSKAIIDAQEQERRFIGGELHDNINQLLASSLLALAMVKKNKACSNGSFEFMEAGKGHILDAIDEVRKLSHKLAPPSFDDNSLLNAFQNLLQTFNLDNQFKINLYFDESCNGINGDVQINLYRILQEQMKNIVKYAEASEIDIAVTQTANTVKMRIFDNGIGFDVKAAKDGIGLSNMRKRADSFAGIMTLNTEPGKGCEIIVEIPLVTDLMPG